MNINFRQGIIAKPTLPSMLYENSGTVGIRASLPIILAFAHGKKDYIYTVDSDASSAWVLPSGETSVWLYWEIDHITGLLTYGTTISGNPLVYGTELPSSPIKDQHFFDLNDNKLKVWGGGKWIEKIRLFAGEWNSGKINELGIYSQANLKGQRNAGKILFDRYNRPVFNYDNDSYKTKYFATDEQSLDNTFLNTHKIALDKLQLNAFSGEPIPKHKCVVLGDDGLVYTGSRNEDKPIIGLSDKEYASGQKVSVITHGFVENREDWNWEDSENTNLFVDTSGNLTSELVNDISSQIIAKIVSPKTIFVNIQERIGVLTNIKPPLTVTPTVTPTQTPTPTVTPTMSLPPLPFVTTWLTTSLNESVTLPLRVDYDYNMMVDWGDGNQSVITSWDDSAKTHIYSSPGTHDISISGTLGAWYFNNGGDKSKIVDVKQWGGVGLVSLESAFFGCDNLEITAVDNPGFSQLTSLRDTFRDCPLVNPYTSNWNTYNITDMSGAFYNAASANPDVAVWNIANVTDISYMFYNAISAYPDVSNWNTSSVIDMSYAFAHISSDPDVSAWNTSLVENMSGVFFGSVNANPNVSTWNVENVVDASFMFKNAFLANPDVSGWSVNNLITAEGMFHNASLANPNIAPWPITSVENLVDMMVGSAFSEENYELVLTNWYTYSIKSGVTFNAGSAMYTGGGAEEYGKNFLINAYFWTIYDGGVHVTPTPTVTATAAVTTTPTPTPTVTSTAAVTTTPTPTVTMTATVTPTVTTTATTTQAVTPTITPTVTTTQTVTPTITPTTTVTPTPSGAASTLTNDLIAWWGMEEASGTRLDSHTNGYDLTETGAITSTTGKVGSAALATATIDGKLSISIGSGPLLYPVDSDFTMAGWFYLDNVAGNTVLLGAYDFDYGYALAVNTTTVELDIGGFVFTPYPITVAAATWYHFVFYHDSVNNEVGIIINDGTPATSVHAGGLNTPSSIFGFQVHVPFSWTGTNVTHRIDELAAWSRILTPSEITELYNSGNGIGYPG